MQERESRPAGPGQTEPQDLDDLIFRWESESSSVSER